MVYDYVKINKAYPQITINDVNNHLREEFEEINIYTESVFLANTYTLILAYGTAILGYVNSARIVFVPSTTNTGNVIINVLGLGDKKLFLSDGTSQVPASFLIALTNYYCEYDSTLDGGTGAYKLSTKTDDENLSEYVLSLINSAYSSAEDYTKKTITITTFKVSFFDTQLDTFQLRKCPFIDLQEVIVDSEIYDLNDIEINSTKYPYTNIVFDCLVEIDSIKFRAGYNILPHNLKVALLNMIGYLYENRGDCMSKIPSAILCSLDNEKLYSL